MKTLTDYTNGRLGEIIRFADSNNLTTELNSTLSRFYRYLANGYNVELYTDFAVLSMTFALKNDEGNITMNGGFIFHGKHDNGGDGSSPTFTVSLDGNTNPHWSIHT